MEGDAKYPVGKIPNPKRRTRFKRDPVIIILPLDSHNKILFNF